MDIVTTSTYILHLLSPNENNFSGVINLKFSLVAFHIIALDIKCMLKCLFWMASKYIPANQRQCKHIKPTATGKIRRTIILNFHMVCQFHALTYFTFDLKVRRSNKKTCEKQIANRRYQNSRCTCPNPFLAWFSSSRAFLTLCATGVHTQNRTNLATGAEGTFSFLNAW